MGKSDVNKLVRETMRQAMQAKETPLRELAQLLDQLGAANAKVIAANDARTALIGEAQQKFEECLQAGWTKSELQASALKVPRPLRLNITDTSESDDSEQPETSANPTPAQEKITAESRSS